MDDTVAAENAEQPESVQPRETETALADILFPKEDGAAPEEVSGEEAQAESQPEEREETIEPPASWTAEEKKLFEMLPTEAKQVLARRESEREAATQRRLSEFSEKDRAIESERQEIAKKRADYAQFLQTTMFQLQPQLLSFDKIDWAKLAAENPAEYVRKDAERKQLESQWTRAQAEIGRIQQEQSAEAEKRYQAFLKSENDKLVQANPDFAGEKGRQIKGQIKDWLKSKGYSDQELDALADHRTVLIAHAAMKAEQAQQKAKDAKAKAKPVSVQKPGAKPEADEVTKRQLGALKANLSKSHNIRDAAAYLEKLGIA